MLSGRLSGSTLVAASLAAGTAWLSLGVLAVLDDGTRIGVLPSPFLLIPFIALAVAAAAASRLSSQTALPLFLSSLVVVPWLPLRVPDVFLLWMGPAIVLLWSGIGLSMVASLVERARGWRPRRLLNHQTAPYIAAAVAFVAFAGVRFARGGPPGGDEPHYLLIAQSIIEDGDLKVANNYEQQDYLAYWDGFLRPHFGRRGLDGDLYSLHAPGVPAIVAPAVRIGGYRAVVVWIAVLVAFGSALIWKAAYRLTGDAGAAWFGWCAATLTAPVVLYGALVYPDPLGGTLLAGGTYALVVADERVRGSPALPQVRSHPFHWFWVGLGIGLLPWLHTRLALPAAALGLILLLRLGAAVRRGAGAWKDVTAYAAPIAFCLAGWFAFFRIVYGTFNPSVPYGDQLPLGATYVAARLLGLLTDQQFGLLPNAPIHLLWAAGLWSLFQRDRRLALELLMVIVPYVLASSAFPMWYGGDSPPARFLVPVVFPVGVALAALWARQDAPGRSLSLGLLGLSVLVGAVLAFGGDRTLAYNDNDGRAAWLDWIAPLVDLPRGLPSFFGPDRTLTPRASALVVHLIEPAFVWCSAMLAGWLMFRAAVARLPDTIASRTLATACCILAVSVTGVAATWQLSAGTHLTSTRSQLRLLRSDDSRTRPFGVALPHIRTFGAGDARAHLALTTSPFDHLSPDTLLYLAEVPPGDYRLRIDRRPMAGGNIFVGIGQASGTPWQGAVADGSADAIVLHLPLTASNIRVKGDEDSARSIEAVTLMPTARKRVPDLGEGRARDAMRYGPIVVFTIDDRVKLDADGFWLLGQRQPEVIVETDRQIVTVDLLLRNVSVANRVRVSAGRWSAERALAPNEVWRLDVPIVGLGHAFRLGFQVAASLPSTEGSLGCRVEFR